jgi:hypothetical protein
LTRVSIPDDLAAGFTAGFVAAFPGRSDSGCNSGDAREPLAFLSFAASGDMRFGDPKCAANRERFLREAGIEPSRARGLELKHTRNVVFPAQDDDPAILAQAEGGADGLILDARDDELAATVTVADCMPIWILDRGSGAFGLLHSGWRGTGILEAAVRAIVLRFGSQPSSIAVILGPAIGPCCYAVSEERAAAFSAEFGDLCVARRGGTSYIDLRSANVSIAERAGIGHVLSIEACSSCDERFGSYRRQGAAAFTRMLAVCGRSPRAPDIFTARSVA